MAAKEIIFKIVKESKVPQREIAKLTGMSRVTINRFLNGHSELKISDVEKVVNALGYSLVIIK